MWKERLHATLPQLLADEIDTFETEIELRRQAKIDDKVFAETRLRRGVYGQRYDNGQRYDGTQTRKLAYPDGKQTKGAIVLRNGRPVCVIHQNDLLVAVSSVVLSRQVGDQLVRFRRLKRRFKSERRGLPFFRILDDF